MIMVKVLPILLLFFCAALFVLILSLARLLEDYSVTPLTALTFQVTLAALLMSFFAKLQNKFPRFDEGRTKHHFGIAIAYIVIPNAVVFYAASKVPTGYLSVVTVLSALLTYIIALLLQMERIIFARALGIALGFIGTLLLVVERDGFGQAVPILWGTVALIIPLALAVSNVWRQLYWPPQGTALSLATGMMLAAVPCVWILLFLNGNYSLPTELSAYLILFAITIAYVLYVVLVFTIIKLAGAVFIGQINYLIAAFGIITGGIIFHEKLNIKLAVALGLIFCGLFFVSYGRRHLAAVIKN